MLAAAMNAHGGSTDVGTGGERAAGGTHQSLPSLQSHPSPSTRQLAQSSLARRDIQPPSHN